MVEARVVCDTATRGVSPFRPRKKSVLLLSVLAVLRESAVVLGAAKACFVVEVVGVFE